MKESLEIKKKKKVMRSDLNEPLMDGGGGYSVPEKTGCCAKLR